MKRAGKAERHGRARDGDGAVFERLAEDFEDVAGELGELVEEEQAVVGERDLAGARHHAAADQAGVGDGVVRRAEGPVDDQALLLVEHARDGVDLGGLKRLFKAQRREDRGQALGQHGLAGAGWADHQDVVAAGCGDLKRALGDVLAADVAEVGVVLGSFAEKLLAVDGERLREDVALCGGVEQLADLKQRVDRVDVDAVDDGRLARIGGGDDQVLDACGARRDGNGQHAAHCAQRAIKAKLADQDEVADVLDGESAVGTQDADGDGQVETGALFFEVGGSEVDGDACGREVEAGVLDGGADAVAGFADGGVGQAYGGEAAVIGGLDAGEVDLDVDEVGVDTVDGGAARLKEHVPDESLRRKCSMWGKCSTRAPTIVVMADVQR